MTSGMTTLDAQGDVLWRSAPRYAMGQPVLVGHHSERQHREDPCVAARRLDRLGAELRRVQRHLDGFTRRSLDGRGNALCVSETAPAGGQWRDRLLEQAAHLEEQISYWKGVVDRAKAEGRFGTVDFAQVKPGDGVKYKGDWLPVVKVNRVTVTVVYGGLEYKIRKDQVTAHLARETTGRA